MSKATSDVTEDLTITGLGGTQSAKAVLTNKLGLSASLPEVLGAIAIGIAVLVGAGFGIGAGVNYSQDSKAQSALESVKSAEVLYQSKNQSFGALTDLTTGDTPALTSTPKNLAITATATNYCAVIKSGSMSGTVYYLTAKSGEISTTLPTNTGDATCPSPTA